MKLAIAALLALLAGPAIAQHHKHHHNQTPYAGLQQRTIKALSDEQIADLKAGRGMGLALAAELNGYPGPLHVLELKDQLQLTAEQKAALSAPLREHEGRSYSGRRDGDRERADRWTSSLRNAP